MLGKSFFVAAVCQYLSLAAALPEPRAATESLSPRPQIAVAPHQPFKPIHSSTERHKICHVKSHGDGSDDSKFILQAFHRCSPGGRVVFDKDTVYTVGKVMDLTFLRNVDIDIQGKIVMSTDMDYWQKNSFQYAFQDSSTFIQIGGTDVHIYGGGEIDGNGQVWWDEKVINSSVKRPILITYIDMHGGSVSNINLINPPNWFQLVANSSDIVFDNMYLSATSTNGNPTSNSDGWDTYRSDNIVIQNSRVFNTDDCVSFKPNSTNVLVQNMYCSGSHGISVGSLGQYVGQIDIIENVLVYNTSLNNASDGARIKIWPGAIGNSTNTGGGGGYVRNVTYDGMHNNNNDWAIQMTQCYYAPSQQECNDNPAVLVIEDILFKNFYGTTSKKRDPYVATLVCSSPEVCKNVRAENITVVSPSGTNNAVCTNMDRTLLDINCTKG